MMTPKEFLTKILDKQDLERSEAESLMRSIMSGELGHMQIAAILTALRMKGESVPEITGFVSAMRDKAIGISPRSSGVIDTCGTGGDSRQTFNISTATAFVAAGMGVPVAKHGNRAISSRCGSADVLDALGVHFDLEPDAVSQLVDEVGIGFLFAPAHHPAMRYVAPVRQELGIRTVFNLLGPMANPAGVKRQLVGVFDGRLTETVATVLLELGSEKVFVVHGCDGSDEVSLSGKTIVSLLDKGHVHTMKFTPEDAGLERQDIAELAGGSAEENAMHILDVLGGKKGPRRDAVVLNSAFVAILADKTRTLVDGAQLAMESIDSGRALDALERLRATSLALRNGRATG